MKYFTYKLDLTVLNVLTVLLFVFMSIFTYVLTDSLSFIENINLFSFVIIILWMFLHEILHGIGFLSLGKVNSKNVIFGAEIEKGIFYCMCKERISKLNILVALVFPLVLIGIITYIIGLYINSDVLILASIFNISGAIGDILMTIDILMMPRDINYLDLDDNTSFTILSNEDLSNKRYFSIKLDKYGKYTKKVKARNFSKINISKYSKYFLFFYIILIIVAIIDVLGA
mgnify:CR=1 FL=1